RNSSRSSRVTSDVLGDASRHLRLLRLRREVLAGIDEAIGLELVLLVVQLPVAAVQPQQFGVRAALDDLARFEHQDLIRAADRRQPMRDDERRPPGSQLAEAILDHLLALAVEARGGFVEDEDARVCENGARDRHALPLAARQLDAALAD